MASVKLKMFTSCGGVTAVATQSRYRRQGVYYTRGPSGCGKTTTLRMMQDLKRVLKAKYILRKTCK